MNNEESVDQMLDQVEKAEAENDFLFNPKYAPWAAFYLTDHKVDFDVMYINHIDIYIFWVRTMLNSDIRDIELPTWVQNHEHLAVIQARQYARHIVDGGYAQEQEEKRLEHK
jgi:hypothetical protein